MGYKIREWIPLAYDRAHLLASCKIPDSAYFDEILGRLATISFSIRASIRIDLWGIKKISTFWGFIYNAHFFRENKGGEISG